MCRAQLIIEMSAWKRAPCGSGYIVGESREVLLNRIIDGVANDGLVDRSLRELAASAGTSHRMLIYHFGSREGVVSAIVEEIERRQRLMMIDLAAECPDAPTLIRRLWDQVSSMELRPFVRLFFESLASTSSRIVPG